MSTPRQFFESMVEPPYREWSADPLCEWKAKCATSNADIMAERLFAYWHERNTAKIVYATSVRAYREHLKRTVCPDFGLIWDIHDGLKHVRLDRGDRRVTSASQTAVGVMGFDEGQYGEGLFGGAEQLVITLDDGSKRTLGGAMHAVMKMWRSMLDDLGS